ncbi:hypothetical protein BaRGS_00018476 [Batillaria attramentaria]|uniref:Uncharacterized protein n=1 Tax=Batillaria attramentaria TaxID=370345 RepID=A0ABD0KU09_9CAEN
MCVVTEETVMIKAWCTAISGAFSIDSPHLDDSLLIAEEKSTISLNFTISGCSFPNDLLIMVSREEYKKDTVHRLDVCTMWNSKNVCTSLKSGVCSCPGPTGVYTLQKTVERADNTTWVWWTQPKIAVEEKVAFIVSDEPETITESSIDNSFSLETRSGFAQDEPETITESSIDNSFSLETRSGFAQDTAPVTTLPNDPPKDPVLFLYGVDFMVVACVGIIAFAAVVIFVSVAAGKRKVRRGDEQRRSTEFVQSMQPYEEPRPDRHDIHQANNEEDSHSRFSQESSFYWEIRNDPPTPSPELPRPCVWPALSDDYLHPVVSRRVKEGTDDSTTVTPLYENSVLR